jgi:hypothetical protein
MKGFVTLALFALCLIFTIAALATNVASSSANGTDVGVTLFRTCLKFPAANIDKCTMNTWEGGSLQGPLVDKASASKHNFAGAAAFEFFVLFACVAGIVASILERRAKVGPRVLIIISAVACVAAFVAWVTIIAGLHKNAAVVPIDLPELGLPAVNGEGKTWMDSDGKVGPNPALMIVVWFVTFINIFVAWKVGTSPSAEGGAPGSDFSGGAGYKYNAA